MCLLPGDALDQGGQTVSGSYDGRDSRHTDSVTGGEGRSHREGQGTETWTRREGRRPREGRRGGGVKGPV